MADKVGSGGLDRSKLRRASDALPQAETGDVLDAIAGQDVVVTDVEFLKRSGKDGGYTLSVITLDDGRIYHTGSPVVREALMHLSGIDPETGERDGDPVFPIICTFAKRGSASVKGRSYWTVS